MKDFLKVLAVGMLVHLVATLVGVCIFFNSIGEIHAVIALFMAAPAITPLSILAILKLKLFYVFPFCLALYFFGLIGLPMVISISVMMYYANGLGLKK